MSMIRDIPAAPTASFGLSNPVSSKATIASATQSKILAQTSQPNTTSPAVPAAVLCGLTASLLMLLAVAAHFLKGSKIPAKKQLSPIQSKQVPCKNCKFFINNPYLKCAVHPSVAMTRQAVDCSDFNHTETSPPQ